jgi:hypothetical protein
VIALGVDPGPEYSGLVVARCEEGHLPVILHAAQAVTRRVIVDILRHGMLDPDGVFWLRAHSAAIEWVQSYGRVVGATVLETARTCGYLQAMAEPQGVEVRYLTRPRVITLLTGLPSAPAAGVHEAIRDRYRAAGLATGGGADPLRGTHAQPGPLYGVASHAWDALAVLIAAQEAPCDSQ